MTLFVAAGTGCAPYWIPAFAGMTLWWCDVRLFFDFAVDEAAAPFNDHGLVAFPDAADFPCRKIARLDHVDDG